MLLAQQHYRISELLHEQGVIFCYSGYVTETILSGLGQAIKQKLVLEDADTNTINGVFSIFVEQMQNVIRYSAEGEPNTTPSENVMGYGTLTVGRKEGAFFVTCGNKVKRNHAVNLREQLTMIQQLDRIGLKNLYKQILRGEVPEGSKGAGVGFLDIAKRASHPIEFDFIQLDDQYDYFSLKAII